MYVYKIYEWKNIETAKPNWLGWILLDSELNETAVSKSSQELTS